MTAVGLVNGWVVKPLGSRHGISDGNSSDGTTFGIQLVCTGFGGGCDVGGSVPGPTGDAYSGFHLWE